MVSVQAMTKSLGCALMVAAGLGRVAVLGQGTPSQPPAQPAEPPHAVAPAPAVPPRPVRLSDYLVFDADEKDFVATNGESDAHVKFSLTNISQEVVTIDNVKTSCHCTTAHLPPMPWKLAPGTNGEINVTVDLAGKGGIIFKTVTVNTDKGTRQLLVKVTILAPPAMGAREMNQQAARGDRQAVFKGDCAKCHVANGEGRSGRELYVADCGICHDAEHRASMVPDLHHLNHETNRELLEMWISYGRPGSMMPAFAKSEGGPLSDEQIRSLASYLAQVIPAPAPAPPK
jgi:mono/diheme cytochrome c family protein